MEWLGGNLRLGGMTASVVHFKYSIISGCDVNVTSSTVAFWRVNQRSFVWFHYFVWRIKAAENFQGHACLQKKSARFGCGWWVVWFMNCYVLCLMTLEIFNVKREIFLLLNVCDFLYNLIFFQWIWKCRYVNVMKCVGVLPKEINLSRTINRYIQQKINIQAQFC